MNDTPDWLSRLIERDPSAPLDDLTKHRIDKHLRETGRRHTEQEERTLALLWPRWGLVRHANSKHALRLAAPAIEDIKHGELAAMILAALCNFALLRFADIQPTWDTAPVDLFEQITGSYHPDYPAEERTPVTHDRYQHVADALGLSGRKDWPEIDRIVRMIFGLSYGADDDDELLATLLYDIFSRLRPMGQRGT